MVDDYLSRIPENYKNIIISKSLNDNQFKCFLSNCSKINLDIFDNSTNNIYDLNVIIYKLNELKKVHIKNYGMKVFKYYSEELDTALSKMNMHHKRLILKIEVIDNIIGFLSKYDNNTFEDMFKEINILKINYSEDVINNDNNIIDFDSSLFITSDEYDSDKQYIPLQIQLKNNDPFLAEYSN